MKKRQFLILTSILFLASVVYFFSCWGRIKIDHSKTYRLWCGKVIISCHQADTTSGDHGPAIVWIKIGDQKEFKVKSNYNYDTLQDDDPVYTTLSFQDLDIFPDLEIYTYNYLEKYVISGKTGTFKKLNNHP